MIKREIKFRGKRIDNNEWIYGSYHKNVGTGDIAIRWEEPKKNCQFNNHWILVRRSPTDSGWTIHDTFMAHEVIPETVGEFTGRLDKNSNEIYDGDFIKTSFKDGFLKGEVYWNYFTYGFSVGVKMAGLYESLLEWDEDVEIVGNIYENVIQ